MTELGRLPQALRAARAFDAKKPGLAATTRLAYQAELRGNDQVAIRYFRDARVEAVDATTRAFVEYHLGATKRYRATICFGATSTTDDIDGERTPVDGPPVTREAVEAAMAALTGPIRQVPPQYSAVQIEGRRA